MLGEGFVKTGGKAKAQVGVDIDLGDTGFNRGDDIGIQCPAHFACVKPETLSKRHKIFAYAGGSVKHEGNVNEVPYGFESREVEMVVAGELVRAMLCANGNGETVALCLFCKGRRLFRICQKSLMRRNGELIFCARNPPKFCFDRYAMFTCPAHNLTSLFDVLRVWEG